MSIVDERGTTLYVKTINGNKASTIHGLLTWQSQSIELQNSDLLPKNLSLRVQTFLRSLNGGEGHWAIDNVRTCKADGKYELNQLKRSYPGKIEISYNDNIDFIQGR